VTPFIYSARPARVVFGDGTLDQLPDELARLQISRPFLIGTPSQASAVDRTMAALGDRVAHYWPNPVMHTPVEITEQALAALKQSGADGIVAIGGGSAIGLSKALALHTDFDQILVPTTYSGSEMTAVLGQTRDGVKTTTQSDRFMAETVIYDVELTMSLPRTLSGLSGMNAIAHAVEALYAANSNPVTDLMAEEAIRAMAGALPLLASDPSDRQARSDVLYGAWLCSQVLGMTTIGLHHKLAHVCGGSFNLSHAHTHTILLPHSLAYNAPAVQPAIRRMARALGREDVPQALRDIAEAFGAPRGLKEIGMPEDGIDRAVETVFLNPYDNPRPLDRAAIHALIARAWAGEMPL